jgi:endo-1,4-beta-xylanase
MHLITLLPLLSLAQAASQTPFAAPPSIDARYKAAGKKYFGTCTDQGLLTRGNNGAIIEADFGQVTPENSMKWQPLNSNRGQYSWGGADYLVNWATNHSKLIRGHTLVWHSQLPGWVNGVNDKAQLTNVIQTHIATVMGRWRGKIYAWVGVLCFVCWLVLVRGSNSRTSG